MQQGGYISAGLGCGLDPDCGCSKGLGDLLDPSTWGPADWALVAGAAWIGWKLFTSGKRRQYRTQVRRRLGAE
jgi:hypothetical protein